MQKGDSLSTIARRLNVNMKSLADFNKIKNVNKIYIGQEIKLPEQPVVNRAAEQAAQVMKKQPKRRGRMNPRQRAMQNKSTAPVESKSLMARSRGNVPPPSTAGQNISLTRKALGALGINVDPFIVALDQAKLSVAEQMLGEDSEIVKNLAKPITERDLGNKVVKAMRDTAVNMFREGSKSVDYSAQGTSRPGDIFETGLGGLLAPILDPSQAASYTTGETGRGAFTLDKNNNLILNDVYDFPDVAESAAYGDKGGTYLKVHNLFEPRGTTGEEGFTSGLFAVSPENTRKMTINLGKAPKDIIQMLQPQYIASASGVGSSVGGGG